MTKSEFRALNKTDTLEILQDSFEDPDDEFSDMSKAQLTEFGLNNWDNLVEPDEPEDEEEEIEEEEIEEESPSEVRLATDLYTGRPRQPKAGRPESRDLA